MGRRSDADLLRRADALRAEADAAVAALDLPGVLADVGPVAYVGSYVSGLMTWRDLDVGVLANAHWEPREVLGLMARFLEHPDVWAFGYVDERAERCPTGKRRDERYHVPFQLALGDSEWRIDLSIWLYDLHENVRDWHEHIRDSMTSEERVAVLRIKDVWHRLPTYPDEVGGGDIYEAVLRHGLRTPSEFDDWLVERGLPGRRRSG